MVVKFNADGTEITEVIEYLDSLYTAEFMKKAGMA